MSVVTGNDRMKMTLSRDFTLEFDDEYNGTLEVTSIDITSNGCYVVVGCSNGVVLLFDVSAPVTQKNSDGNDAGKNGLFLGQIYAKGMHTSLLVNVIISDDGNYIFAGVNKGSMELLAFDISLLPVWSTRNIYANNIGYKEDVVPKEAQAAVSPDGIPTFTQQVISQGNKKQKLNTGNSSSTGQLADWITLFRFMEPKLRGFGAVMCVLHHHYEDENQNLSDPIITSGTTGSVCTPHPTKKYVSQSTEYLLACGKGIKNVHIFSYYPYNPNNSADPTSKQNNVLQCLYDVSSNGNTIENLCFRMAMKECCSNGYDESDRNDYIYYHVYDQPEMQLESEDGQTDGKDGKLLLLSKSNNANVRVWDMTQYISSSVHRGRSNRHNNESNNDMSTSSVNTASESNMSTTSIEIPKSPSSRSNTSVQADAYPLTKCAYEDIANSSDIKYLFNTNYCYGGLYQFIILNTVSNNPTVSSANGLMHLKNTIALPEPKQLGDESNSGRSRSLRQIDHVVGTQDGCDVLLLCSDGAILYYHIESKPMNKALSSDGEIASIDEEKNSIDNAQSVMSSTAPVENELVVINDIANPPTTPGGNNSNPSITANNNPNSDSYWCVKNFSMPHIAKSSHHRDNILTARIVKNVESSNNSSSQSQTPSKDLSIDAGNVVTTIRIRPLSCMDDIAYVNSNKMTNAPNNTTINVSKIKANEYVTPLKLKPNASGNTTPNTVQSKYRTPITKDRDPSTPGTKTYNRLSMEQYGSGGPNSNTIGNSPSMKIKDKTVRVLHRSASKESSLSMANTDSGNTTCISTPTARDPYTSANPSPIYKPVKHTNAANTAAMNNAANRFHWVDNDNMLQDIVKPSGIQVLLSPPLMVPTQPVITSVSPRQDENTSKRLKESISNMCSSWKNNRFNTYKHDIEPIFTQNRNTLSSMGNDNILQLERNYHNYIHSICRLIITQYVPILLAMNLNSASNSNSLDIYCNRLFEHAEKINNQYIQSHVSYVMTIYVYLFEYASMYFFFF